MSEEQVINKKPLVQVAEALLALKRLDKAKVAEEIGVPLTNINSFLDGVNVALSPEHSVKFFYHLGLGDNQGESSLLPQCVHYLYVNKHNLHHLAALQRLMPGAKAIELPFKESRTTPYLVRCERDIKAVVLVTRGWLTGQPNRDALWFTAEQNVEYPRTVIPGEYQGLVYSNRLGLVDFDALFDGVFPDWTMLRQIANSHYIAYKDIWAWMRQTSIARRTVQAPRSLTREELPVIHGRADAGMMDEGEGRIAHVG